MAKISAAIVAYCDYDEVCVAVRSILSVVRAPELRLFVVDNASPDGCGARLAATDFGDDRVTVRCLPQNVGFGKGHNSILPELDSDVHFILNPDIQLFANEDTLTGLADWMLARPGVVMATPQLYYPDGQRQDLPRRKPTPWLLLARQLAPRLGGVFAKANDHYLMRDEDLTTARPIEFCTGSFMAVRTAALQAFGGFDQDYFMYVEDADVTQRALQVGEVWLAPQFRAIHAWHRDPVRDADKFMMQLRSMGLYFKKWGVGKGKL